MDRTRPAPCFVFETAVVCPCCGRIREEDDGPNCGCPARDGQPPLPQGVRLVLEYDWSWSATWCIDGYPLPRQVRRLTVFGADAADTLKKFTEAIRGTWRKADRPEASSVLPLAA